jgi:hypothetical protein
MIIMFRVSLMATALAVVTAQDICTSDSNTFTAVVDLFAGELGKLDTTIAIIITADRRPLTQCQRLCFETESSLLTLSPLLSFQRLLYLRGMPGNDKPYDWN